jgi:hypothetical protein
LSRLFSVSSAATSPSEIGAMAVFDCVS